MASRHPIPHAHFIISFILIEWFMVVWVALVCAWRWRAKPIGSDFRTKIQINYVQQTTYQVEARLRVSARVYLPALVIMPGYATRQHTLHTIYMRVMLFLWCLRANIRMQIYLALMRITTLHFSPAYGVKWLNFRGGTARSGSSLKWKFIFY